PSSCGRPSGLAFPPYDVGLGRTLSGVVESERRLNAPIRPPKHTPVRVCFQYHFHVREPHRPSGRTVPSVRVRETWEAHGKIGAVSGGGLGSGRCTDFAVFFSGLSVWRTASLAVKTSPVPSVRGLLQFPKSRFGGAGWLIILTIILL